MARKNNNVYAAERQRKFHSGLYAMPMSEGPPMLVRLHGAYETQHLPFQAETVGQIPDIVAPVMDGDNLVFLSGIVSGQVPTHMGTHSQNNVNGEYIFVNMKPKWITSIMDLGLNPSDKNLITKAEIRPTNFVNIFGGSYSEPPAEPQSQSSQY